MDATYSFKQSLHHAAGLYYDNLQSSEKATLVALFRKLDVDGNGVISKAELLDAFQSFSMHSASLRTIFSLLDRDGNGTLNVEECKALLFVQAGYAVCDHCNSAIIDNLSFTCQDCWNLREALFDLCLKCYPHKTTIHPGNHRFQPRNNILHQACRHHLMQAQCAICGDFHIKGIAAFLNSAKSTKHMMRRGDEYVCEWCFSRLCNNCGKFFLDMSAASPGLWLQTSFHCKQCGQSGNKTNYDPVKKLIKDANVCRSCSTCRIKTNNDTLWASMSTSSSTSTSTVQISEYNALSNQALVVNAPPTTSTLQNVLDVATRVTTLGSTTLDVATNVGCSIL